ncbi:hypothetical protein [Eubacterium sp.]|uniref:hypothetical protein n=1 Tax=Eubacterium sp. TaxID=142586 RepID=UPI003F0C5175
MENTASAISAKEKELSKKIINIMTVVIGFLPFVSLIMAKWRIDNDTYWIIKTGEYICNNGIPTKDFLTMHKTMDLVVQQWAADVIFYKLYSLMGFIGPMLLVLVMYGVFLALMKKLCLQISNKPIIASIATFVAGVSMTQFFVTRPQIFTYSIIIIELLCLERFVKDGKYRHLAVLPVLSVLEVNLHASMWTMLFIILLPYFVNALPLKIKGRSIACCKLLPLIVTAIVMGVAGLITPYGFKGLSFLFTTSIGNKVNSSIMELHPFTFKLSLEAMSDYVVLAIVLCTYLFYKKGKTTIRYVLLTVGTCAMMFTYIKLIPYFVICATPTLLAYIDNVDFVGTFKRLVAEDKKKNDGKSQSKLLIPITVTLIAVFSIFIVGFVGQSIYSEASKFIKNDGASKSIIALDEAIDAMQTDIDLYNVDDLRLFNGFNAGAYLEFKGYTTYIDPRADSFVEEANHEFDYLTEYSKVAKGEKNYKKVFDKYDFNYALVCRSSEKPLYINLKNDKDYELVFKNKNYAVFKKTA